MKSIVRNITVLLAILVVLTVVSCQKGNEPVPYGDGWKHEKIADDNSNLRAGENDTKGADEPSKGVNGTGDESGDETDDGTVIGGDDNEDDDDGGTVIGGDDNEDDDDAGDQFSPDPPGTGGKGGKSNGGV